MSSGIGKDIDGGADARRENSNQKRAFEHLY
jgi:hypothetical protein